MKHRTALLLIVLLTSVALFEASIVFKVFLGDYALVPYLLSVAVAMGFIYWVIGHK